MDNHGRHVQHFFIQVQNFIKTEGGGGMRKTWGKKRNRNSCMLVFEERQGTLKPLVPAC